MKKVILCLLLLIPILVILTIDASGKLIASALVDIPAERIRIKHEGKELVSAEIKLEDYKDKNKKYTLFCEVFPGIATDEMLWTSSNASVATVTADRKDSASVSFKDYGTVDIICTSQKDNSVTARVTFYVDGLTLGYLRIGEYGEETLSPEGIALPVYGVKPLFASVKPVQSARDAKVQWSVEDESIATVDNNGVLTAVAAGRTTLTASVTEQGKTVSDSVTVTVSEETALVTQPVVYVWKDSIDLTPYLAAGASVDGGSEVIVSSLQSFESKVCTVRKDGRTESIRVVKVGSAKTILIENSQSLKEGVLASMLALDTSNIELKAQVLDGSSPSIEWRSTDSSVAYVKDGRLCAVGSGSAEIYPAAEGYYSERITVNVVKSVEGFTLSESSDADKASGLLQEKVFASRTYVGKENYRNTTYELKILSATPADVGTDAFTFVSADTDIATVDEKGVVTFADDAGGKAVTITAIAYNRQGQPVRQSYTFHIVDGVNVGLGMEDVYEVSQDKMDFTAYEQLRNVAADHSVKSIVLHSDVYYPSKAKGGTPITNMSASLYGNGRKLDGQFFMESVEDTEMLLLWDFAKYTDMPDTLEVEVRNVYLQATKPTSDDSTEAFDKLSENGGGAIGAKNPYPSEKNVFRLNVKGCLFQYAYGHVNVSIGDFVFDGCIFRNNSASSIVLQQSSYGVANAKIKNCIFSNTIAPVGIACGNFDDILDRMHAKDGVEIKSQFGKLELAGSNYVYNWKKLKEVRMDLLPKGLAGADAQKLVPAFNGILANVIQQAFMLSDQSNLYIDSEGEKWLNFSFLILGIWEDMNPQVNGANTGTGIALTYDTDQYRMLEVAARKAPGLQTAKTALKLFPKLSVDLDKNKTYHILCLDEDGGFNTLPGETYAINSQTYARLRGEN